MNPLSNRIRTIIGRHAGLTARDSASAVSDSRDETARPSPAGPDARNARNGIGKSPIAERLSGLSKLDGRPDHAFQARKGPFTVAIDGPAASGKGTISRAIAAEFGMPHLDTGQIYRAVALRALAGEDPVAAAESLMDEDLARDDLRGVEVALKASRVAAMSAVRAALSGYQRAFARRDGGAVLDGRDIGTVICPEAEVKLFVTADDETRSRRRFSELTASGERTTPEKVLANLRSRDERDSNRKDAPLKMADDAVLLDTTALTIDEAVRKAIAEVGKKFGE